MNSPMTCTEIIKIIQDTLGPIIIAAYPEDKHPRIHINATDIRSVAELVYGDPRLKLDWLQCLSGVDYVAEGKLAVVYDLWSFEHNHSLAIKAYVPRDNPRIATVSDLWSIADWHEREAFDMYGILFEGHPDLRRILCPDDWTGYPLRKDYVFPREYHGIPGSVELDWQQKPDYPK